MSTRDAIFALLEMLENSGHDISGGDPALIAADIIHEEFGEDHEIDWDEAVEIQRYIIEWQQDQLLNDNEEEEEEEDT